MANCPHCKQHLKFWHIKAECPYCNVNIPNYDWENRLDQDAVNAEEAWKKFRILTRNLKSSLFGSKLRIIRFIFTFVPLIVLVLPLATYLFNLPFLTNDSQQVTLLDFTLNKLLNLNFGSLFNLVKLDELGIGFALILLSLLLLYLAVVFGVLNFLFVLISAPTLRAKTNCVFCGLSLGCFVLAPVLYTTALTIFNETMIFTGSIGFGIFVGIFLFALNLVLNFITDKGMKKEKAELILIDSIKKSPNE